MATVLNKFVYEIDEMPHEEFQYWYARSLVIPMGINESELQTARVVASNAKISVKECYNEYLEPIFEDDDEFLAEAEAYINQGKTTNE